MSSIVKNQCEIARDIWSKERAIVSQNAYDQIYVEGGRDSISQDPVLWNIPIDNVVSLDEDNPAYNVIRKSLEGNNANEDKGHFNNVRASFELQKRREIEWARKIQNHENSLVIVGYNHFIPKFGKFVPSLANKGLVINPVLDLSEQYNKTKNNNAEINRFQRLVGLRDSVAA